MGFLRGFRLLLIFIGVFGFAVVGLQSGLRKRHLYEEHQRLFKAPVTISVEEFIRLQPTAGWFKVTGVTTYAVEAVFRQGKSDSSQDRGDGSGTVEKVIIPAHFGSDPAERLSAQVVLITDHLRLRKVVNELQKFGLGETVQVVGSAYIDKQSENLSVDETELKNWIVKNKGRVIETRTVEGIVRSPDDINPLDARLYRAILGRLASRHVILEEGVTPKTQDNGALELGLSTFLLSIGGILVLFFIGCLVIAYRNSAADITAVIQSQPDPQPYTYSFNGADGTKHTGVDEETLLTLAREERIPMGTLVRIENTGEIMPVSTLVMLHKKR